MQRKHKKIFALVACLGASAACEVHCPGYNKTPPATETSLWLTLQTATVNATEKQCQGTTAFRVQWSGKLKSGGTGPGKTEFSELKSYSDLQVDLDCSSKAPLVVPGVRTGRWEFTVAWGDQVIRCEKDIPAGYQAQVMFRADTGSCA